MDDAERIPIDIGYEVAGETEAGDQPANERTTVREDGTLVIDILARPCEPEPSTDREIVVCAAVPGGGQLRPLPPPASPNPMEKLEEALTAKVGPLVITPFGIGLKF